MLLAVAVLLLLPGCGGHVVQIVPLAVNVDNLFLEATFIVAAVPTNAAFYKMCMRSYREVSCTITDG